MTFQDTGNLTGGQMTVYIDIWQGSNSNISGTNVTSFSNTVTFDPNSGMAFMDWAVDLNAAGLANGDYVLPLFGLYGHVLHNLHAGSRAALSVLPLRPRFVKVIDPGEHTIAV